jgi:hypothetical protein
MPTPLRSLASDVMPAQAGNPAIAVRTWGARARATARFPPEPVLGPAKPDPSAGTTKRVLAVARHHLFRDCCAAEQPRLLERDQDRLNATQQLQVGRMVLESIAEGRIVE